jgi:hypothetical protein
MLWARGIGPPLRECDDGIWRLTRHLPRSSPTHPFPRQEFLWRVVAPSADAQGVTLFDLAGATMAALRGLDSVRAVMALCQTHYMERS